jgi:hypothetical protein
MIGYSRQGIDRAIEDNRCGLVEKGEGLLDGEIRPLQIGIQHLIKSGFVHLFQVSISRHCGETGPTRGSISRASEAQKASLHALGAIEGIPVSGTRHAL